jgi:hypothetical protein
VGDFSDFWRIFQIRYFRHLTENAEVKLLEVLSLLRGAKTADPRNIIYTSLCLATDVPQGSIVPDATKTVAEVHQDVAWYSICHSRDPLDFLGYCCRFYVKCPSSLKDQIDALSIDWTYQIISFNLASWIPQWTIEFPSPKAFPKICAGDDGTQKRLYNVWGLKEEESQYIGSKIPPFFIIGSTLLAQGFVLDYIKITKEADITSSREYGEGTILKWTPIDRNKIYTPTGETFMAAFLRTIAVDLADTVRVKRGGMAKWNDETDTLSHVDVDEINQYDRYCSMRRLVQTEKGYMALAYFTAEAGDVIFALKGGSMFYVLRPQLGRENGDEYIFIVNATYMGLWMGKQWNFSRMKALCWNGFDLSDFHSYCFIFFQ